MSGHSKWTSWLSVREPRNSGTNCHKKRPHHREGSVDIGTLLTVASIVLGPGLVFIIADDSLLTTGRQCSVRKTTSPRRVGNVARNRRMQHCCCRRETCTFEALNSRYSETRLMSPSRRVLNSLLIIRGMMCQSTGFYKESFFQLGELGSQRARV